MARPRIGKAKKIKPPPAPPLTRRDTGGRFAPGTAGGPGLAPGAQVGQGHRYGTPAQRRELEAELWRPYKDPKTGEMQESTVQLAVRKLRSIVDDNLNEHQLAAIRYTLDRVLGRPRQHVELKGEMRVGPMESVNQARAALENARKRVTNERQDDRLQGPGGAGAAAE